MIDWVSGFLPCTHSPINSGYVMSVSPDGTLDWCTPKRRIIEGSHSQKITVKSSGSDGNGQATELYFSGNPSKFLQGHNIFGSDNLAALMFEAYLNICTLIDLVPTGTDLAKMRAGDWRMTRVDINYSFELPSRSDVFSWLRASEFKSKTRHGRPSSTGGTLYWGKDSQRWSLKAYSKGEEIQKHKLPERLLSTPLSTWADNKLRIELVLRKKELEENNLHRSSVWEVDTPELLFKTYLERLEMTEQIALTDDQLIKLPSRLRSTYILWKEGHDLRPPNMPRNTYYRHRKELLEHGIDINLRQDSIDNTNVVPLVRILEATPAQIPDWAFQNGLIHDSAQRFVA
jgi:II/X family phage/plasmid replication protein